MSLDAYDDMSHSEALDLLRHWRETNERKSDEVIHLYFHVLDDKKKLGNEDHLISEQVLFAALDSHMLDLGHMCLYSLSKEFPDSLRVTRYHAALLEAEEKYDEALEIIDKIIKADETNAPARKRRVAIFKAQGLIPEAIKELVDYLKKFMADVEAWQELCELYLQLQEYSRAAFCAEELILHQPHNHLMHQRLADIRYTMGGTENMEAAKSYYSQALKLNPDNIRALLGLFLATNNLMSLSKSSGGTSKRKDLCKLNQWVIAQVTRKQRDAQSTTALHTMMSSLAISE